MKKTICLMLAFLLLTCALVGCKKKEAGAFTADNDIFTYRRIDPNRTQLVVSRTGNISVEPFCVEFENRNPDVQIVYLDITGGNTDTKPAIDWVKHGCAPDIMFSTTSFFTGENVMTYFENLSANKIIGNYEVSALTRVSVNSNAYWLPGPSSINCIMYNKTLFAQYGWKVPNTFDEFVALCLQIQADTDGAVEPWNPNAKYYNELQLAFEAFSYEELFGGAENREWYNNFTLGNATFEGHMEPCYKMIQTLIDNGILRPDHYTYSATTRGKEFQDGKIAMINVAIYDGDNETYDFGYMPYPTTSGTLGYISDTYSCYLGVPKKTHTEKEADALDRFLEFFSSAEGQLIFIGDSMKVSNVKNVPLNQSEDLAALSPAIEAGHMFGRIEFLSETGKIMASLYNASKDMVQSGKTAQQCIAEADERARSVIASGGSAEEAKPEALATAASDMTILETSFYIADAYREKMGAEIALIANNEPFRGNVMRIFKGDITPSFVNVLKPRSFENGAALVKVSMTGRQLMDALNAPPGYENSLSESVYAFSGLRCEIAPWNGAGKKYLSVKLAGGADIDMNKRYTVACWSGTVADAYITEVLETCENTFEEILSEKLSAEKTIAPAKDGRVKLIWT